MLRAQASRLSIGATACYRADGLVTVLIAQASRMHIGAAACYRADLGTVLRAQASRYNILAAAFCRADALGMLHWFYACARSQCYLFPSGTEALRWLEMGSALISSDFAVQ